jgi:hypothetical protein
MKDEGGNLRSGSFLKIRPEQKPADPEPCARVDEAVAVIATGRGRGRSMKYEG